MASSFTTGGGTPLHVIVTTAAFAFLGGWAPPVLATAEPFLVLGLMLLLGLPHGATDHSLFLALKKETGGRKSHWFYPVYLGGMLAYGLVWYLTPGLAFAVFILLSVYHFGQSNWVHVRHGHPVVERLHYLVWGTGVLLTPILLHAEEANGIVAAMTGIFIPVPGREFVIWFIGAAAGLNIVAALALRLFRKIDTRRLVLEVISYVLLLTMFLTNSLLLGFTVYFVFWHSLSSAHDQLRFFDRHRSPELRRRLSLHIGSTILGAFAFCLLIWLGPGPGAALQPAIIGGVFIAVSLLTLPHMLLVERLYAVWSPIAHAPPSRSGSSGINIDIIPSPPAAGHPIGEGLPITH